MAKIENFLLKIPDQLGSTSSIILHTCCIFASFLLVFMGVSINDILLSVTTVLSIEAIYLSLFIQLSVNKAGTSLKTVTDNTNEIIQEIDLISEDVDDMQEDIDSVMSKKLLSSSEDSLKGVL